MEMEMEMEMEMKMKKVSDDDGCFYMQLLHQPRFSLTGLHEYKSILMVAVFGCFTMKSVQWTNAPIIGGWAVLFTPMKIHI